MVPFWEIIKGEALAKSMMKERSSHVILLPALLISNEMKINGTEHVFLDCTKMDMVKFCIIFPISLKKCLTPGNDAPNTYPCQLAAHYSCGGINRWMGKIVCKKSLCLRRVREKQGFSLSNRASKQFIAGSYGFASPVHLKRSWKIDTLEFNEAILIEMQKELLAPKEMILIT